MADVKVVTAVYGKDWTLAGDLAEAIRAVDPRVRLTVPVNKDELAAALPWPKSSSAAGPAPRNCGRQRISAGCSWPAPAPTTPWPAERAVPASC